MTTTSGNTSPDNFDTAETITDVDPAEPSDWLNQTLALAQYGDESTIRSFCRDCLSIHVSQLAGSDYVEYYVQDGLAYDPTLGALLPDLYYGVEDWQFRTPTQQLVDSATIKILALMTDTAQIVGDSTDSMVTQQPGIETTTVVDIKFDCSLTFTNYRVSGAANVSVVKSDRTA